MKLEYVSPKIEIVLVELEECIAASASVKSYNGQIEETWKQEDDVNRDIEW
ncbi:MAG: hypothetical protein H6Q14_1425 [Bacteroidetes bacterium]|nr:hypothetical protein [Bacteroidota bacterium]